MFSERIKGSGLPTGAPPTRADIITDEVHRLQPIDLDVLYNYAKNYQPTPNPYNFFFAGRYEQSRGYSDGWPFAWYISTMYNHFATPNWDGQDTAHFSAIMDTPGEHGIVTARSAHPGGVNVLTGDGAVRFVKDAIARPTWQALGTRNGNETISGDAY